MERSGLLAKAIKAHSGKSVEGLIPSGLTAQEAHRFKLSHGKATNAEEAQAAERAARKATREAIASLGEKANGIKAKYQFINADYIGEKRPNIDYAYSLTVTRGEDEFVCNFKLLSIKRKGKALKVTYSITTDEIKAQIEKCL